MTHLEEARKEWISKRQKLRGLAAMVKAGVWFQKRPKPLSGQRRMHRSIEEQHVSGKSLFLIIFIHNLQFWASRSVFHNVNVFIH